MWLNSNEISRWAYDYCKDIEDRPGIRNNITNSIWAYSYCRYIKDRPEVRKYITHSYWAFCYSRDIRKYIKEGECG